MSSVECVLGDDCIWLLSLVAVQSCIMAQYGKASPWGCVMHTVERMSCRTLGYSFGMCGLQFTFPVVSAGRIVGSAEATTLGHGGGMCYCSPHPGSDGGTACVEIKAVQNSAKSPVAGNL